MVFHDRDELREIVKSTLPFSSPDLEIIVVDGFSQDGTVEALREFGNQIEYWISEPDGGIYHAMNKGLQAARGTYVLHLNAGDRLLHIPWQQLRECADASVDVVCCRVLLDSRVEFISRTSLLSKIDNTWHHQGTFYRRAAHLGYDTRYPTGADFHHNQRLCRAGCTIRYLPALVANHASDGVTASKTGHAEIYQSVRENYGIHYLLLAKLRFTLRDFRDQLFRR